MALQYPDGGLIDETNANYYAGQQVFVGDGNETKFQCTFNTQLVIGVPTQTVLSNFEVYVNGGVVSSYTLNSKPTNQIEFNAAPANGDQILVKLTKQAVEDNYGSYEYISLKEIVSNFMVGYVGDGKLIQTCKKSDVVFFAKRSLQEFSYDTLKSIRSQELTIPSSLSLIIPQDYVNYVNLSWIDELGVKRPIYPANNLTTDPYSNLLQDATGVPTQDNFGEDLEGTSITESRWKSNNTRLLNSSWYSDFEYFGFANPELYGLNGPWNWGRLYGLDPQRSQVNGWFGINEREGKFSFSSNLTGKLIVFEYISDGLAYDLDTKVPKMAEEAMYKSISYNILSTRANVSEGVVQRYKKDRYAALRNAKIRLSNIKLEEISQVMRGKSKWIKH